MPEFILTGTKFLHRGKVYAAGDTVDLPRVPAAFAGMFEPARYGAVRAEAVEPSRQSRSAPRRRGRPPKRAPVVVEEVPAEAPADAAPEGGTQADVEE